MRKTRRFFMLMTLLVARVSCGSRAFHVDGTGDDDVVLPFSIVSEKERVLSHLHYSLDAGSIDRRRGTVELSFYFTKQQGDSLLWVECVERVPLELIDTALCHRWLDYDYTGAASYVHF